MGYEVDRDVRARLWAEEVRSDIPNQLDWVEVDLGLLLATLAANCPTIKQMPDKEFDKFVRVLSKFHAHVANNGGNEFTGMEE